MPIIMLRYINQPKLCNGTRLSVKKLMTNIIEARILTGPFKGEVVLILRIPMIPTDMSFQFKRLQLPIRLAFAITINKAQGQSLQLCGLYLHTDCFSHGQLYVACSIWQSRQSLYLNGNWNYQEYCVSTSIGKLNILETCIFFSPPPHLNKLSHSNAWQGTASIE